MCFFKKKKKQPEQPVVQPEVKPEVKSEVKPEVKPSKVLLKVEIPVNMYKDLKKWASVEYRTLQQQVECILALSLYKHDNDPEMTREPNRYQNYVHEAQKKAESAAAPATPAASESKKA